MPSRPGSIGPTAGLSKKEQNAASQPPRSPSQLSLEHPSGHRSPLSLHSPQPSREPSPSRQWLAPGSTQLSKDSASPGNPLSPNHMAHSSVEAPSAPSALTSQKAASSSIITSGRPSSLADAATKLWKLQKQDISGSEGSPLHWPVSPRFKPAELSISPRRGSASSTRPVDPESIVPRGPQQSSTGIHDPTGPSDQTSKSTPVQPGTAVKVPRGFSGLTSTLETVQEGDHPTSADDGSPDNGPASSIHSSIMSEKERSEGSHHFDISDSGKDDTRSFDDSGSITPKYADYEKNLDAAQDSATPKRLQPPPKKAQVSLVPAKIRAGTEGSSKLMTVETETVSSIPQTSVGGPGADKGGAGRRDENRTLRMKPSTETIKPRKEKKKTTKKVPSIIAGTASSKADIFEAKVASAVDEDSSDSDETFVYESNPPEPRSKVRHHSRTPSVTSVQSFADRRGGVRAFANLDGHRRLRGKRSMKFVSNSCAASSMDEESGDGDQGTVRASRTRASIPSEMQYQHIGLYGRQGGGLASPLEFESPFSQASKLRNGTGVSSRNSSKPHTPSNGSPSHFKMPTRRDEGSIYEFGGNRADDERAPLIDPLRTPRMRPTRRPQGTDLEHMQFYPQEERGWVGRFVGCVAMVLTIMLIVMGVAGFLFATTKPLFDVNVHAIENVLASEQEIMLDLLVEATNPNIAAITIADMDVNIFAKSRHVGSDGFWRLHGTDTPISHTYHTPRRRSWLQRTGDVPASEQDLLDSFLGTGGIDEGTDPMDDPATDPQTMLLGQIFHFDSALTYDGSPFRRTSQNSTGEMRLQRPGNKTEAGGTERWERIIQFPFELIVRGVFKYQLPLSSQTLTASVGASVIVHPERGIDDRGTMKVERVTESSGKRV